MRGARGALPMLWLLIAALSCGGYLWLSVRVVGLGFPLDDAWIHQTYARNLVSGGEWAFQQGSPSAGSTGPLWSFLLAPAHAIGVDPRVWAYALGTLALAGTAWICRQWLLERRPGAVTWSYAVAGLALLEWHLVWAAVSGMETLALACVAALVLWLSERESARPAMVGLLIGLATWIRPDALLLLGALLVARLAAPGRLADRVRGVVEGLAGCSLLVAPYLGFNRALSGEWWPTTFFAKQAEYAVYRQAPILERYLEQLALPLVGAGAVLVVGAALGAWKAASSRHWFRLAAPLWILAHLGAYAWRLPVTYQHGRYAMPVLPALIVLGMAGWAEVVEMRASHALRRVASRAWAGALIVLTAAFWIRGGRAYAQEVGIIETEMVAAARWVSENTPEDALIAAHDIGALGYFGERRLIDLAGLVSPEVIPFLRDEIALRAYLDMQGATHLVTFPGWYPRLTSGAAPLFETRARFSPAAGGENMAVYAWPTTSPGASRDRPRAAARLAP